MQESDFLKLLIKEKDPVNVISELSKESLPLILWGAGDVAHAVKHYLTKNKISLDAVWVDNNRDIKYFEGLPVLSLEEVRNQYKKFNVILGHSNFNLGNDILRREKQIQRVFYLVSVFYDQYENIDFEFVKEHSKDYFAVYQMLEDESSRTAMTAYLNARINNNIEYINDCVEYEQNYFKNDIFQIGYEEDYADVGAYDGDTIRQFLSQCEGKYNKIYAIEPEEENFKKLQLFILRENIENIYIKKIGTWSEKKTLYFQGNDEKRSTISFTQQNHQIFVDALDQILDDNSVSMLKINFMHGVLETLMGAKHLLQNYKPKLAVVVGFDEWALINIPCFIKNNFPEYNLYLRFNRCMPACLTLYAI